MLSFNKSAIILSLVILGSFLVAGLPAKLRIPAGQYEVQVTLDQIYYSGPDYSAEKHRLDIFNPAGLQKSPVLFFVHGGSWWISDRKNYHYVGYTFASRGITTVVMSYRLSPQVQHPAHIKDVAAAFRWVFENISRFGGDEQKIFVGGHSAGAHLGALLALDEEFLQAEGLSTDLIRGVISLSGIFDVNSLIGFSPVFSSDRYKRRLASPITYVDEQQPPFLLIYSEREFPLLEHQSQAMFAELEEQESKVEIYRIEKSAHLKLVWDIGLFNDPTTAMIYEFIQSNSH